jgi:hypothetical protein
MKNLLVEQKKNYEINGTWGKIKERENVAILDMQ